MNILIILIILIICLLFILLINTTEMYKNDDYISKKSCCLYAYYEKNESYKNNFEYFLNNGILDNVDYYIIINGDSTVNIPQKKNIIIYNRENKGYDFGAWSYCVNKLNKIYDYYFFINTSVSGPYLISNDKPWTDYFIELFNNKIIKVVGTSINIYSLDNFNNKKLKEKYKERSVYPHVQSMFFCIDNEYLNYLKLINFFNEEECNNYTNINDIIYNKEFGLSLNALDNNWNINSILNELKNIDYINIKSDINPTSWNGDPYFPNAYFGKSINKNSVIFFKNNRL